jgi:riboflavin biosynthesis pyrimidine reductase
MYETMVFWENAHTEPDVPPHILQYARDWQAAEKVVYSATLESVSSAKTRIEREFDPDAVRKLKAEADHDLTVDGPNLAAQAIAAGLVDEYHLFMTTSVVGGGKAVLPRRRAPRARAGRGACLRQWTHLRALPGPMRLIGPAHVSEGNSRCRDT